MSPAFSRSRLISEEMADNAELLRMLLASVDRKRFGVGQLDDSRGRLDVDIAASVVEARAEELEIGGATAARLRELEATESARLRLVIAALHYLVMENDVIHDRRLNGHIDDVAIVRWVTKVARGDIGVPIASPVPSE